MIQTMALSSMLPPMRAIHRHDLQGAPSDVTLVYNGFLQSDTPPARGPRCLFAGVSGPYMRRARFLDWMRRSPFPVGARDPATAQRLGSAGLAVELVGCATLTLPRYEGPRSGVYSVDFQGPGAQIRHAISRAMPVREQWELAGDLLDTYRTANAVYTTRLHVALPCLAFGTPVWIGPPAQHSIPERFSLLEELGVPFNELVVRDVTQWANRYCDFLRAHLGNCVERGEPKLPTLPRGDLLPTHRRVRLAMRSLCHAALSRLGAA